MGLTPRAAGIPPEAIASHNGRQIDDDSDATIGPMDADDEDDEDDEEVGFKTALLQVGFSKLTR